MLSKPIVEPLRLGRRKAPQKEQTITPASFNIFWELLEMEAPLKFYINGKDTPAFLLFPKYHWASSKSYHHLYMNTVGLIGKFTAEKKALARLKEIVENANFPVRVYKSSKYGRNRGKRILFAENKVQRIELTENPCKVFNIDEWEREAS